MYVVKRPFRDAEGMVPASSIVEPAGIKRFKHRVLEGHIVEVNEQNFERYADFFKQRYGVDLPSIKPAAPEKQSEPVTAVKTEVKVEKPVTKVEPAKPTEVKKVVTAK